MRVEYVKTILEKIDDVIDDAVKNNKIIQFIEIDKKEWYELIEIVKNKNKNIVFAYSGICTNENIYSNHKGHCYYRNIEIVCDLNENN